jgi:hypothetical protein
LHGCQAYVNFSAGYAGTDLAGRAAGQGAALKDLTESTRKDAMRLSGGDRDAADGFPDSENLGTRSADRRFGGRHGHKDLDGSADLLYRL